MSTFHPAPGRRLGLNASCLLLTILSANHAAARADLSLPYLTRGGPEELRFAPRPVLGPPPVRPMLENGTITTGSQEPDETSPAAPAAENPSTAASATVTSTAPAAPAHAATPPVPAVPPASTGVIIVPDAYAPITPIVTIEQLLPFFVPPAAPASRATYEMK